MRRIRDNVRTTMDDLNVAYWLRHYEHPTPRLEPWRLVGLLAMLLSAVLTGWLLGKFFWLFWQSYAS